jgi:hypothetical protein
MKANDIDTVDLIEGVIKDRIEDRQPQGLTGVLQLAVDEITSLRRQLRDLQYAKDLSDEIQREATPEYLMELAIAKGLTQDDAIAIMAKHLEGATKAEINEARERSSGGLWDNTTVEIDSTALASRGDNGVWVSAWVWLPRPETDDETG